MPRLSALRRRLRGPTHTQEHTRSTHTHTHSIDCVCVCVCVCSSILIPDIAGPTLDLTSTPKGRHEKCTVRVKSATERVSYFLFPVQESPTTNHLYTHLHTLADTLLGPTMYRCTGSGPGGKHLGELPTQGRTNQHTMSLRSCPKEACHTTADPEGCPTGRVHHCPLSPPAFAFIAWGHFSTGHKHPVTPASMSCRIWERRQCLVSVVYAPIPWTHPTANRVRWHTREISRGRVCPRVARSITHLVIQAVGPRGKDPPD